MSGTYLFIIHNSFATVELKVVAFSSENFSAPSVASNNLIVAGYVTPINTSSPIFFGVLFYINFHANINFSMLN